MNMDKVIFRRITENLEEVLDAVPPLRSDMLEEVELFSRDFCEKVLIDFYNCPDVSKKSPQKILEVLFDGALLIRMPARMISNYGKSR